MKKIMMLLAGLAVAGSALAKLPSPTPEQEAKAAEAKAKAAWSSKVDSYKLCMVQDKVVARYLRDKGKPKPAFNAPACENPGPFVAPMAAAPAPAAVPAPAAAAPVSASR